MMPRIMPRATITSDFYFLSTFFTALKKIIDTLALKTISTVAVGFYCWFEIYNTKLIHWPWLKIQPIKCWFGNHSMKNLVDQTVKIKVRKFLKENKAIKQSLVYDELFDISIAGIRIFGSRVLYFLVTYKTEFLLISFPLTYQSVITQCLHLND